MPEPVNVTDLRPWTWPWLLATSLSRATLAAVICLALWGAVPAVAGWHPTTVSSGSMLPRLHVGDVAVSRPLGVTPPAVGTVLLFDDPDHPGRLRLHRFVRVNDDGLLVTRGDANTDDDSTPVALTAVRGIGTLRVPWVGLPIVWLRERDWVPLGLTALVLSGLGALAARSRSFGFPGPDEEDGPGDTDPPPPVNVDPDQPDVLATPRRPSALPPAIRPFRVRRFGVQRFGVQRFVGLGLAAVLLIVTAAPAEAAFSGTAKTTSSLGAATYFSCANAVTASRPYLWYRLDETSSTTTVATDSSGNARTGVYGSAGKTSTANLRGCVRDSGRSMTFDGSSGYLSSPVISTVPNTFTIGIWFKTTTTRGGKLIGFGNQQTGLSNVNDRHLYLTNAGVVVFGVYPGTVKTVASPTAYNDGGWHQAVATMSSAGIRLYVDGVLLGSDSSATSGDNLSPGYLRIGYDNLNGWPSSPTSYYFAGTLDDAAFYPTALSAAEIAAQYEAGTS